MPIYILVNENIDSLWTFGGSTSNNCNAYSGLTLKNFSFNNKGASDRDFNMPICVRYIDKLIYVLDSGNNRIKIINKNGQFVSNIKHGGLNESSCTALALQRDNKKDYLLTLNWRLKCLSKYDLSCDTTSNKMQLSTYEIKLDEPICLMETFHPELFLVQDNKKKLYLCTSNGRIVHESLEVKIKQECGIKNIIALCGHFTERRIIVAGLTTTNSPSAIYEFNLDWLCDFKLDPIIQSLTLNYSFSSSSSHSPTDFICKSYCYPLNQKSLSSSLTSLASTISVTSTTTTLTTNSSSHALSSHSNKLIGSYTALWHDVRTSKLLAAKSDKHKTVIEVFNSKTHLYEYSIESSQNEKPLKKVTSICSTDDGKVVCVDLVQNFVKIFRFI